MRYFELSESIKTYLHGSMTELPVGMILTGRGESYSSDWSNTDFYHILEKYRPSGAISHRDAVFMVGSDEDIDLAGGGTEFIFTLQPLGPVEKHDVNWSSEISMLLSDGFAPDSEEVVKAAQNYWAGVPHPNENVWEYLTTRAKILAVEEY